jgi:hypothetical protein
MKKSGKCDETKHHRQDNSRGPREIDKYARFDLNLNPLPMIIPQDKESY